MTPAEYISIVEKLGLPVALLFVLGAALALVCRYVVTLIRESRDEREKDRTAHIEVLAKLAGKLDAVDGNVTEIRRGQQDAARALERIEARAMQAARGFTTLQATAALWLLALALVLVLGCAHEPAVAKANIELNAAATAQSGAGVVVKRGPRTVTAHLSLPAGFALPADAGAALDVEMADQGDEVAAQAQGASDAGLSADAGAVATVPPPSRPFPWGWALGIAAAVAVWVGLALSLVVRFLKKRAALLGG